eukprot:jgi/Phyca11/21770/fgenesh1_pg.PHYCAscaffold_118_\
MQTRYRLLLLVLLAVFLASTRASGASLQETTATSENPRPDGPVPTRSLRESGAFWLYRGTTPEQVLEKLKVVSKTDENYKYYARYYFRYYVKYPNKMPKNAPTKTADAIMKARLQDWLDKNLSPPQVFKELGFSGTFASAQGHPDYKYFEHYISKILRDQS